MPAARTRTEMKPKTEKPRTRAIKRQEPAAAERPAEGAVSRTLFIQATQALGAVLAFDYPADAVLSRHFRDNRELTTATAASSPRRYGVLRRLHGCAASPRRGGHAAHAAAGLVRAREGWPMRNFEGLASATERDWITSIKAAEAGEPSLAERADLPDWLAERLLAQMDGDELLALAQGSTARRRSTCG